MQNYQIAMVKELSIVLGINHQELPEHPSDQNKGFQFTKEGFSQTTATQK